MTNKYKPHVLVLPEDDANRQIANGFLLNPDLDQRAIQVLPHPGGWAKVVEAFTSNLAHEMRNYPERRVVLVIDFDDQYPERFLSVKGQIPDDLEDRVFILGALSEPEDLKKQLRNIGLDKIGEALADDCSKNSEHVWGHELLKHNHAELTRLTRDVRPFLFL